MTPTLNVDSHQLRQRVFSLGAHPGSSWAASGGLCSDMSGQDTPCESGCLPAGDVVSPTEGALSLVTGVTAPALSTETAALGLETPASSPSPGRPWGTPAAGQAQTPGTPPQRGDSGMVEQDRNRTAQGVEESEPSEAPGLGTSQWTASRAPGPTHSSLPGATDGLSDTPRWLLRNSTTEPHAWPTPAESPTGHVWHASLPTWGTPPAPLDPTMPQNTDPGRSSSPDLPLASTPASLKPPACGECLECWGQMGPRSRHELQGHRHVRLWDQSSSRNTQEGLSR